MTNYLLAGGGTAGHVNPLLALADAIAADSEAHQIWALGTAEGLESRLVPERGYRLLTIARLPFPRKISFGALKFVSGFFGAVTQVQKYLREHQIDVVVGFGGYASAPAYLAAKRERIPLVIHEANALPGMANRWAAKWANALGVAFKSTKLANATFVGMPLRREIQQLAQGKISAADKVAARAYFGLDESATTLLVTGGSLGAKRINETIEQARGLLRAAGVQVLHIVGDRSEFAEVSETDFVRIKYCDRMDLAITAADFAVARAGAATVCEFTAVGLPAVYVPYPVGNGEQKYNVADAIEAGAAILCLDAEFNLEFVQQVLIPKVSDTRIRAIYAKAAKDISVADGAQRLLTLVNQSLR